MRYNTATSNQLTLPIGEGKLTLSQVDSHASHSPRPGSEEARMMTDISGRRCLERLGRLNHVGSWAKMFTGLLIGTGEWYSTRCYLTWKMKGMKSNRLLFQLAPSTHRTEGTGFGLLLTPAVVQIGGGADRLEKRTAYRNSIGRKYCPGSLEEQVKMGLLPTPREAAARGNSSRDRGKGNLEDAVAKMGLLPTPTSVSDLKGGCTRAEERQNDTLAHSMHGIMNGKPGTTSQLNHRFVAEMMGFPVDWTELPFLNSETNP